MTAPRLKVSRGALATVRLNRPEARNAMDAGFFQELAEAFAGLSADPSVRVVVLSAEGKDFCAGADLNWMRSAGQLRGEEARKDAALVAGMCLAVARCRAPVVARVQGGVYGGGLGLVASCDIAIAGLESRWCFSEVRLGVVPAVISPFVLRKIGAGQALRCYLTAEPFTAKEALAMGLVQEAVPEAELDAKVDGVVKRIMANGPGAVAEAKALVRKLAAPELDAELAACIETLVRVRSTPEAQEGLKAFLEKRPASWSKAG
ncbi:MAG: enoyl-CoA hydratase/isomerase family protein [Elusimicrobia bacterium]|nr:enoyl-CoA hydratase/isomerase family protein [Elusimicrobiota bacterium]